MEMASQRLCRRNGGDWTSPVLSCPVACPDLHDLASLTMISSVHSPIWSIGRSPTAPPLAPLPRPVPAPLSIPTLGLTPHRHLKSFCETLAQAPCLSSAMHRNDLACS